MKLEEAYSRGRLLGWRITYGKHQWLVTADGADLLVDSNFGLPPTATVHYHEDYERPSTTAPGNWGDVQLADCGLSEAAITALDDLNIQTLLTLSRIGLDPERMESIPAAVLAEVAEMFWKRTGESLLTKWSFVPSPRPKQRRSRKRGA